MRTIDLAYAILLTQDIHEGSWDTNSCKYVLTIDNAAIMASQVLSLPDTNLAALVGLLCTATWNDAQLWALNTIRSIEDRSKSKYRWEELAKKFWPKWKHVLPIPALMLPLIHQIISKQETGGKSNEEEQKATDAVS